MFPRAFDWVKKSGGTVADPVGSLEAVVPILMLTAFISRFLLMACLAT
jgi:hypothetical protein